MAESALDDVKIAAAIDVLGLGIEAAELHGGLCGLLCASGPGATAAWARRSGASIAPGTGDMDAAREHLHEAELESWRRLSAPSFEFEPLLPSGEADLTERVAALALWCHGFVTGLGLGGLRAEELRRGGGGQVNVRLVEIVDDFVEISRAHVGPEDLDDADRADFDLEELIEYVRAGVQLVFEELRARRARRPSGIEPEA